MFVSVYLHDSIGVSGKKNLDLLHEVAGILNRCARPWIMAGDWQDPPEALASTGFLQRLPAAQRHRLRLSLMRGSLTRGERG